jgi:hypothetical protein
MTMASFAPGLVAAAILNDMGALLEAAGSGTIYQVLRSPPSFRQLGRRRTGAQAQHERLFPNVGDDRWRQLRCAFIGSTTGGSSAITIRNFRVPFWRGAAQIRGRMHGAADLWKWFAALRAVPTLVLRGENSELLSAETVAK